jgi:hypothetical protein
MKKLILAAAICISSMAYAQTTEQETEAVKTVCNYYIDGGTNGDSITFSKAFSPTGQMQYMRNDTLQIVSLKDFMARMKNTGTKQTRTAKIESVEVYGNAATAKITIEYATFYFHDIMGLLKTKDGWKIVSKIFYREMK